MVTFGWVDLSILRRLTNYQSYRNLEAGGNCEEPEHNLWNRRGETRIRTTDPLLRNPELNQSITTAP